MLLALRAGDRAKGERLRAQLHEQAAHNHVKEVELINSSFYRAWQDWEALEELKKKREEGQ